MKRVRISRFLAVVFCFGLGSITASESTAELLPYPRPILTKVQDVRRLTAVEANRKLPIRLVGVVTHANPIIRDFFVQDETAGIYVNPTSLAVGLVPGDEVALEGVSSPGGFAPCVIATKVRKLDRKPLPEPLSFDLSKQSSRWLDGQWVQVWCLVRSIGTIKDYTAMTVSTLHETGTILIPGETHAAKLRSLRSASVRIRAVCVPSFGEGRIVTGPPRLFMSSPEFITVIRSPEANRAPPAQLIDHLYGYTPEPDPGSRAVKVRGVVTGSVPKGPLFLQDESGAIVVNLEAPNAVRDLPLGERVEATGFLEIQNRALTLHFAQVRRVGEGRLPEPIDYRAGPPAKIPPGTRVRFAGKLAATRLHAETHPQAEFESLVVDDGGPVRLECVGYQPGLIEKIRQLKPDSQVQVTGLFRGASRTGSLEEPILITSAEDLVVLRLPEEPSWWTPPRIVTTLGGIVALTFLTLFWNASLRKRVHRQTEQIRRSFERESQLEQRLNQSQKMEAIGRLAGGIAHDFNNLLTVINGCADLLKSNLPPDPVSSDLLDDIVKAGEKAATLTSQLLVLSKHRVMHLAGMHLNESVLEAVKLLRRIIGASIEIRTDYTEDLPPILGEKGMIHQILLNLAVNARDAMPDGGKLSISTSYLHESQSWWVRLRVSDTGHGMDGATKARVFEPFFTTKPVGQGTGLGLATVYGLVQALKGRISFHSEVGHGTSFDIDFPPTDQPVALSQSKTGVYPVVKKSWKVLVVEDDPAVQRFVQLALEQAGFAVQVADEPLRAIEICKDEANEFDLIVTDMVMPEMSGKQLAEVLLELRPRLPILFVSGYSPDELRIQGMSPDDWPFLQKPFPPAQLVEKIKEMLTDSAHRLSAIS